MLKSNWVQNIILLLFAGLLIEVLTPATLILLALGLLLAFLEIRPKKWIRNVLAIGIFVSYWMTYGKLIDPEVGLNFLTSIIVLKILERETDRDRYMIFFGLMLLISSGSLFERTITYVVFFSLSFLALVKDFYFYLGQKWRLRDLGLTLVWVLPLTFSLFFLVPRMMNPIPFQQGGARPGEIGYTPDVNLSGLESLSSNASPVFQALVSRPLQQNELYWRGNTLSFTDGWNWNVMMKDRSEPDFLLGSLPHAQEVKQSIRLFTRADYFFTLDSPRIISFGKETLGLSRMKTLPQKRWQWVQRYDALSLPGSGEKESLPLHHYLTLPLSRREKKWIGETFKGGSLSEIKKELETYFIREKFSYSLAPGKSASFEEFMTKRKIGLCSHYASALAIILRARNIPSRLVSGFMGGTYNRFANFYLISQNDAHVWVEAHEEGQWKRLDPTEWIAPDRVLLGGEAFMENVRNGTYEKDAFLKAPRFLQDFKQWLGQWDFLFYLWLEEMDYHAQDAWLSRLKFKREWLFTLIPMIMVVFISMYSFYLFRYKTRDLDSEYHELWRLFLRKLKRKGLTLPLVSLKESEQLIKNFQHPEQESIMKIWEELVQVSFKSDELKNLKKRLEKF